MTEETITQTETGTQTEAPKVSTRLEDRVTELSSKVELTSKERDELKSSNDVLSRDRDFYKGYSEVVTSNPEAKNHQEEIKEKFLKGYTLEDATFAVLGKAGKLGNAQHTTAPQVAGGSSATAMPQSGTKEVKDMSQAERRAQLVNDLGWS